MEGSVKAFCKWEYYGFTRVYGGLLSQNDCSQAVNIIGGNGRIYTLERDCFRLVGESLAIINSLPSEYGTWSRPVSAPRKI